MFEAGWKVKPSAGVGMGVGSSGLPEADSSESLVSQPWHITWLVYPLNWPQPRPLTKIRESKCGYDGIMACVGCASPSHQGSVKQPSVSSVLSDVAGDEILFPNEGTNVCESGQNKSWLKIQVHLLDYVLDIVWL